MVCARIAHFGFLGASVSMTGRCEMSTRSSLSNVCLQMASMASQSVMMPWAMG